MKNEQLRKLFENTKRIDLDKATQDEINARVKLAMGAMSTREKAQLMASVADYEEADLAGKLRLLGIKDTAPKPTIAKRLYGWFKKEKIQ